MHSAIFCLIPNVAYQCNRDGVLIRRPKNIVRRNIQQNCVSISTEQTAFVPKPAVVSGSGSLVINGVRLRIFLVSFTLLFFELLCIRWIPAYVRYLSYFTNFILLASFLGMGLGILAARRATFRFPSFPLMVLLLAAVVALNRFELNISSTDVLYFGSGTHGVARTTC